MASIADVGWTLTSDSHRVSVIFPLTLTSDLSNAGHCGRSDYGFASAQICKTSERPHCGEGDYSFSSVVSGWPFGTLRLTILECSA